MERITIMFKPSGAQQAALEQFLGEQQDPGSPNYHKWLTPEEFGDRFGLSPNDVNVIVSWLQTQGFTVDDVARTRRWVSFSGSAQQVESAFQTTIHEYAVEGEKFYANATDPSVPAALANVVSGFRSLNNFRLKPRPDLRHVDAPASGQFTSSFSGNHYLSPADFATIYDLSSLYSSGFDGTGQKIAIMGQTDIQVNDVRTFRAAAGLPPNDPQIILVPGSSDPGVVTADVQEASLDIEWSGAVARNAQIIFVNSKNGVFDSLLYAVDQSLAPVVSMSYGSCEKNFTRQDVSLLVSLAQQANAQGMTILAASGDTGAADCEKPSSSTATLGLAVDIPASLPYVTAMGGTEFREATTSWTSTNDSSNGSAISYIPEVAWNDTTSRAISAGGGGRSIYFSKPAWQTGTGVPNDSARDVPDISLSSSGAHDGYLICALGSCVNGFRTSSGGLNVVGGTSVAAPAFAGIVAIINQVTNSSQANINPKLYSLAATAPAAFHDITAEGNQVPCQIGTTDCPSGGSIGYNAGVGYDQATGLGSVDVAKLIAAWSPSTVVSTTGSTPVSTSATTTTSVGPTPVSTLPPTTTTPLPIPDVEQGTVHSGYAVITPDASSAAPDPTVTFGTVSGGTVQSQGGILPMPMMTDASLFVDVVRGIGRDLGVALANPSSATSNVILTLRDQMGNLAGSPITLTLQPQQQSAKFVSEIFPSVTGVGFRGTLEIQSSVPFGVLGLRFSGTEFSTLPVTGTTVNTGVPVRSMSNGAAGGNTAIILPQFAMAGGWATQIALVNNSGAVAQGRIDIFDTSGNPMQVNLNGVTQSTFSYAITAGGVFMLAPRDANGQTPF